MRDVSTTEELLPFPEVVRQFLDVECVLIGRLAHGPEPEPGPDDASYRGRAARLPIAVLATPDRQALVAVDTVAGQPFVRLRSVLANGDLVETVQRDRVPPTHPDPAQPAALDAHQAAPGRHVHVSPFWDARESLDRHGRFLAGVTGKRKSTPETLDSMAEALLVWDAAERHDRQVAEHGERIVANARTLLLAGAVLVSMLVAIILVGAGVDVAIPVAAVIAGVLIGTSLLGGIRLTGWLFGVRRLRPRFALR